MHQEECTISRAEELRRAAAAFGAPLPAAAAAKIARLAELVAEAKLNLTAIKAWEQVLVKHLLDSLAPLALACPPLPGQRVADLGSGGGFPGLVLAAAVVEAEFTLIEAVGKKAAFLAGARDSLRLANVTVLNMRAEEACGDGRREAFDLVTARAIASLPVLVELAHPLLRVGGGLLAWKGPEGVREIEAAAGAMARLPAETEDLKAYELPAGLGQRLLILIRKTGPTPAGFPRRPGMAEKRPL